MPQKKIPTLLGLVLLIAAVAIFGYAFDRVGPLLTIASTSAAPANVLISNISDSGFTLSWTTKAPATGAITVESDDGKHGVTYDERDTSRVSTTSQISLGIYTTHTATFRNAKPNTSYRIKIISNGTQYQDTSGNRYEIKTGPQLEGNVTGIEPAFGTVTTTTGQPAEGALLYLTLENGQLLSTIVKSSGSWVIPLNLARLAFLDAYIPPTERIDETLIIRTNVEESQVLSDTLNDNPMPEIMIGKTYDFRKLQVNATKKELTTVPPSVLGTTTSTTPIGVIAITKPKDNQALPTNFPIFQGTGVPNKNITLIIGITNPQVGQTTVGVDGIWRYTPTTALSIGKQSVTLTTTDAQNKPVAMTHMFEILKSGTQVLGEATPSATIAPTPTIESTSSSTLAGEPIPDTGFPLPLILLLSLATLLITSGGFMLLKPKSILTLDKVS